jgi:hypothetical protein
MFKAKSAIIFLLVTLVYSTLFSFLYNYFVVVRIDEFDQKFKNVQRYLIFELPKKDTYFVKIWGLHFPEKIYFNQIEVSPFKFRERGILKEIYIVVNKGLVNKGQNILNIISNESYSVKIRNYYGATASKGAFVVFKLSSFLKFRPNRFISVAFSIFIILNLLWPIFYITIKFVFLNFKFERIFLLYCIYNFGLFLLLSVFILLFSFTSYRIILSQSTIIGLSIFLLFLLNSILFYHFIYKHSQELILSPNVTRLISSFSKLSLDKAQDFKKFLDKSQELHLNFFLAKLNLHFKIIPEQYLISAFIFLLLICMILLVFKLYTPANWVSYIACFCLLIGLLIKCVKLSKENE